MKKYLILILLIFSFVACNKTTKEEEPVLELIAYRWQYDEQHQLLANGQWGDTIIEYLENELYAQIYKDGNCFVNKKNVPFKEDIYSNFKIDTAQLNPALRVFKTDSIEAIIIEETDLSICDYKGPIIRLIGKDKNDKEISLKFCNLNYSGSEFVKKLVKFYKHINSKTDNIGTNERLFYSRDNRLNEIYNLEINSSPTLESTIQFTVPELKK